MVFFDESEKVIAYLIQNNEALRRAIEKIVNMPIQDFLMEDNENERTNTKARKQEE